MRWYPPSVGTRRTAFAISTVCAAAALAALALACGMSASDALSSTTAKPDSGTAPAPPPLDAGRVGLQSGVVLVHAASFPAFRVCFDGTSASPPLPTNELMPESNVVGVDVGSAVRLDAPSAPLGRAFLFPEDALRDLYPPGVATPPCSTLLGTAGIAKSAVAVPAVAADVSSGVHVLALTGCRGATYDLAATTARCGATWSPAEGNLELVHVALQPSSRPGDGALPVQALQLSVPLAARGRSIDLGFGPVDAGAPAPILTNIPAGVLYPTAPAPLAFDAEDAGTYAAMGLFVSLGAQADGGDAGPAELVLAQSLADVQRLSNPRILPQDWYGASSTYVIVLLGDPDPRLVDGGGTDPDVRRRPHLLAVPLQKLEEPDAGP